MLMVSSIGLWACEEVWDWDWEYYDFGFGFEKIPLDNPVRKLQYSQCYPPPFILILFRRCQIAQHIILNTSSFLVELKSKTLLQSSMKSENWELQIDVRVLKKGKKIKIKNI